MIYVVARACILSWRGQTSMVGHHVEITIDVVDDQGLRRLSHFQSHEP